MEEVIVGHSGMVPTGRRLAPTRGDQTRNLEIPGSRFARPGMTMWGMIEVMSYYVYILASRKDGATYVGITNDLVRRIYEHRTKAVRGFTSKYNITRLVWFEIYDDPISAISREKELKKWKRAWKIQLIEAQNPEWQGLYESICT
jgi:putative endonuclease